MPPCNWCASSVIFLTSAARIRATAVCPGFVDTDMTSHVTKVGRDSMSRPEDVAALIESVLRLPNNATVAELLVTCRHEDTL